MNPFEPVSDNHFIDTAEIIKCIVIEEPIHDPLYNNKFHNVTMTDDIFNTGNRRYVPILPMILNIFI